MDAAVKRAVPSPRCYQRRRPERTLWYRTVQTHFETWLALSAGQGDASPPAHVEQALAIDNCSTLSDICLGAAPHLDQTSLTNGSFHIDTSRSIFHMRMTACGTDLHFMMSNLAPENRHSSVATKPIIQATRNKSIAKFSSRPVAVSQDSKKQTINE